MQFLIPTAIWTENDQKYNFPQPPALPKLIFEETTAQIKTALKHMGFLLQDPAKISQIFCKKRIFQAIFHMLQFWRN